MSKLQIPSPKLQAPEACRGACGNGWLDRANRFKRVLRGILELGIWSFPGAWCLEFGACLSPSFHRGTILCFMLSAFTLSAEDAGFGPPISVPRSLPESTRREMPARNRIDQTPEEALRKSRGCLECHKGIDTLSMHASANVVLGCADCHGGNPAPGLT